MVLFCAAVSQVDEFGLFCVSVETGEFGFSGVATGVGLFVWASDIGVVSGVFIGPGVGVLLAGIVGVGTVGRITDHPPAEVVEVVEVIVNPSMKRILLSLPTASSILTVQFE